MHFTQAHAQLRCLKLFFLSVLSFFFASSYSKTLRVDMSKYVYGYFKGCFCCNSSPFHMWIPKKSLEVQESNSSRLLYQVLCCWAIFSWAGIWQFCVLLAQCSWSRFYGLELQRVLSCIVLSFIFWIYFENASLRHPELWFCAVLVATFASRAQNYVFWKSPRFRFWSNMRLFCFCISGGQRTAQNRFCFFRSSKNVVFIYLRTIKVHFSERFVCYAKVLGRRWFVQVRLC